MILSVNHVSAVIRGRELGVTEWIFLQGYDSEHDMIGGLNKRGVLVAEMLVPRFESNDDYFLSTERNSSIYSRYCIGCGVGENKYHFDFCESPMVLEICMIKLMTVRQILFCPQILNSLPLITDSPVILESTKQESGFFTEKMAESYSKSREADTVVSITKKEINEVHFAIIKGKYPDIVESIDRGGKLGYLWACCGRSPPAHPHEKDYVCPYVGICPGCEKIQKDCSNSYGACVRNRPWGRIDEDPREMSMNSSDYDYTHAGKSELDWAKDITKRPVHLIVMVDDNSDPP